jgi:hypothetical protein
MNNRSAQLSPGAPRRLKAKNPPQSLILVLLPMLLSVMGGAAGYFFFRDSFSRATEVGIFLGYFVGWAIEASVRVPRETEAQRKADAIQAAITAQEKLERKQSVGTISKETNPYEDRSSTELPPELATR